MIKRCAQLSPVVDTRKISILGNCKRITFLNINNIFKYNSVFLALLKSLVHTLFSLLN
jgi:hypothetical protein